MVILLVQDYIRTSQSSDIRPSPSIEPTSTVSLSPDVLGESFEKDVVSSVVDGDTVHLASGKTVRYIGIDTPETKKPRTPVACFGEEATKRNTELVEGKTVYLEKDVSEVDRYGRLLRYVYVEDQSGKRVMVNEMLVAEGFAQAVSYPPDIAYQDIFLEAERNAREAKSGLWGSCTIEVEGVQ